MQITKEQLAPTKVKLTIEADADQLAHVKKEVLAHLAPSVKLQGFRPGKAPMHLVEKALDPNQLQTEFLQHAVNDVYVAAIDQEKVRPVAQPEISVSKFVPFDALEVVAEIECVGDITLPDYKKVGVKKDDAKVEDKQVDEVVKDLLKRGASRQDVDRAAKLGDEATIDFKGVDAKTKEAIAGADGTDYPLELGSGSFIPGFEEEVVGLKVGDEKSFDITFPEDYGAPSMQGQKVNFTITVKKLQELVEPTADDAFAATVGPFKSLDELKGDIRKELEAQAAREIERKYENELLEAIAKKTTVEIPKALVDEELDRIEQQERQDLMYRGQTWQEHLDAEGVSEEEHREKNRQPAELRVKAGLVLGEIAEVEKVDVSPEELEIRVQLMKGQYATDARMLEELEKPENRRDIMSRLLTEKTLDHLKRLQ